MEMLLKILSDKNVRYPAYQSEMVDKLTKTNGLNRSEESERYKPFSSVCECFMYAAVIGLRTNYRLPFEQDSPGVWLQQIKYWEPADTVQYITMGLLAKADFAFVELENLTEQEADQKAAELVNSLETYAKGGFEIMEARIIDVPYYFEEPGNVVVFLQQLSKEQAA